jgi:hypothetical protein
MLRTTRPCVRIEKNHRRFPEARLCGHHPTSITARQYQSLHCAACRLADELPRTQLLDGLIAAFEARRKLHMTKTVLIGLLGSVALRCIDG